MENQLITTVKQLPMSDIMSMGKVFAESGMFSDIKQAAQAIVKIQAGQELGIPPFQAMTGIHIIQGKPTVGAGLMASRVKGSGKYDYKVVEQNEKVCNIDYYQGKQKIGNSTFTIEDARKAGTKNLDKFPKNMLFARAMSNGVKWFCPDIFSGPVYVPEEMIIDDAPKTEDVPHTELKPESGPKPQFKDNTLDDLKKEFLTIVDNDVFSSDEKDTYCKKMDSWTIPQANKAIDLIKMEIENREKAAV